MSKYIAAAQAAERAQKWGDAEKLYRAAVRENPKDIKRLILQVEYALRAPGGLPGAFLPLKSLLRLAPKSSHALRLAALANYENGDLPAALDFARKAVRFGRKDAETHNTLSFILQQTGEVDEALHEVEQTLRLEPNHRKGLFGKAGIYMSLGRLDEAAEICRDYHKLFPDELSIYNVYSLTGKLKPDDPMVLDLTERLLPLAIKAGTEHHEVVQKTIAKLRLDQGDHEAAFLAFRDAKAINPMTPDFQGYKNFVDGMVTGINRADFFGLQGSSDERPVFVVGLPRCGSTLLEQILSSHHQIGGIGESSLIKSVAIQSGINRRNAPQMIDRIKHLPADVASKASEACLAAFDDAQPGKLRVVDKNLHNFEYLALIARLFPKAHILHAMRDPMDHCVSCYMANLSRFHSYTQDLRTMGQFYREHIRLMDHWKKALPNPILEVRYEDVVADTEGKAREIIEFLGLDWDPNCLQFQQNENRARTLSAWQVRQPIYKTSVKRWKRYEKFLDPLKDELKSFYPDGF